MAQDQQTFSHISVTSDDEDDVVIVAGAPTRPSSRPAPAASQAQAAPTAPHVQVEAAPEEPAPAPDKAAPARGKTDAYQETTLDDLAESKMSAMQKAIIVVAIVAIIAFVVYYMVLR